MLAGAGDDVAVVDDEGARWVVHHRGGDGVGGDDDEIGAGAWCQPGDGVSVIADGDQAVASTIARPPRGPRRRTAPRGRRGGSRCGTPAATSGPACRRRRTATSSRGCRPGRVRRGRRRARTAWSGSGSRLPGATVATAMSASASRSIRAAWRAASTDDRAKAWLIGHRALHAQRRRPLGDQLERERTERRRPRGGGCRRRRRGARRVPNTTSSWATGSRSSAHGSRPPTRSAPARSAASISSAVPGSRRIPTAGRRRSGRRRAERGPPPRPARPPAVRGRSPCPLGRGSGPSWHRRRSWPPASSSPAHRPTPHQGAPVRTV